MLIANVEMKSIAKAVIRSSSSPGSQVNEIGLPSRTQLESRRKQPHCWTGSRH